MIALRDDLEAEKKLRMEAQTVYHQTLEDIMEISKVPGPPVTHSVSCLQ